MDCSDEKFTDRDSAEAVRVRSPDWSRLAAVLSNDGGVVTRSDGTLLTVVHLSAQRIGELALVTGCVISELIPPRRPPDEA